MSALLSRVDPRSDAFRANAQAMQALVSQSESISWRIINPQFRVVGSRGGTWGHYSFTIKPHDGPLRTEFARFLLTWVKSEG